MDFREKLLQALAGENSDFEKEIVNMLAHKAMLDLANQLKWNEKFDMETRRIINTYLQMHHDYISQGEKLEFTPIDGLMMAGLLETVMHYKEGMEKLEELHKHLLDDYEKMEKKLKLLDAELKLHRGAF